MTRRRLAASVVAAICLASAVGVKKFISSRSGPAEASRSAVDRTLSLERTERTPAAATIKKEEVRHSGGPSTSPPPPVPNAPAGPAQIIPSSFFPYAQELQSFARLKQKVFLSDRDEEFIRGLVNNSAALKAAAFRLHRPAMTAAELAEQNAAMELVFHALDSGDKVEAASALRKVVADAQVEDGQLGPEARRNLGGLKAEVLYRWSALDPSQVAAIPSWLPGPVSRRIWANVARAQGSNLSESSQLAGR